MADRRRLASPDQNQILCFRRGQWCRLISGAHHGFIRRFGELHRSPPLLGFLCNRFDASCARFVPTSSFRLPNAVRRRSWRAVHSGHGRVLLRHSSYRGGRERDDGLVVWDPITDEQRELPKRPMRCEPFKWSWNAAVLCAAGGGCNHVDCHRGPFVVVFVGTINRETFSCVYSSEADGWSEPVSDRLPYDYCFDPLSVGDLVGNSLYFMYDMMSHQGILEYDLLTQEMSAIPVPARGTVLMATEDGRLGLATVHKSRLYLWSREQGPYGDAGWAQSRVIELDTLFSIHRLSAAEALVAGFGDNGAGGVIFVRTAAAFFTIDLKSGRVDKVGESHGFNNLVVPYMSFCTPGTELIHL